MDSLLPAFILMAFFHFLADYPLQGDFLAKAKNHKAPIPGVPWLTALFSHAFIHAGFVWLITGYIWLAVLELFIHAWVDWEKSEGKIDYITDQFVHLIFKAAFALVVSVLPNAHWLMIRGILP